MAFTTSATLDTRHSRCGWVLSSWLRFAGCGCGVISWCRLICGCWVDSMALGCGCGLIDLVVVGCVVCWGCGFSFSLWWNLSLVGVGWLIQCLVVGGYIEWVVAGRGHEGWVDYLCLEKRDTHSERERHVSWRKKRNYK